MLDTSNVLALRAASTRSRQGWEAGSIFLFFAGGSPVSSSPAAPAPPAAPPSPTMLLGFVQKAGAFFDCLFKDEGSAASRRFREEAKSIERGIAQALEEETEDALAFRATATGAAAHFQRG